MTAGHFQVQQQLLSWSESRNLFQDKCNLLLSFIAENEEKKLRKKQNLIQYLISERFGFANKLISIKS